MPWLEDFSAACRLSVDERVREALWARGVSDGQIQQFGVGHLGKTLPDVAYPKDFLDWSWNGKKLEDCYVFPLTNTLGETKGVQFRSVEREKKTFADYFIDRSEPIMFGAPQAMPIVWEKESVFLVEGTFDFFPVQRVFPNTIATMTARVTEQLVRLLRRLVRDVYLLYDMDETGQRSAKKFSRQYGDEFRAHVLQYPRVQMATGKMTKDPGDLWEIWGDDRLASYLRCIVNSVGV
jgi:DNA primase